VILYSVHIENFKGLRGPLDVPFDENEINLVLGPNGAGKSTLREAIETVLVENHNTSGAAAEQMRPRDTTLAPSITLTFSEGGEVYRVSKTFLDSPNASLEHRSASGQFQVIAKGKAADEQVRAMLRSQSVKAKDKVGERLGFLSVLCGNQDVRALPALSGDALADVRQMLGAQLSGQRGAAFEQAVRKKFLAAWTREDEKAKVKKGRLAELEDLLTGARESLAASQASLAQVGDLESSARAARERHRETSESLETFRAQYTALAAVARQVTDLRTKRAIAQSTLEAAKAQYGQLSREIEAIVEAGVKKGRCEQAQSRLADVEATCLRERDAQAEKAELTRAHWEQSVAPDPEIDHLDKRVEAAIAHLRNLEEQNALRDRLQRAENAARRKFELEAALADLNAPEAATWAEIQRTAQQAEEARIRVETLALRFEIQAETELTAEVLFGEPSGSARLEQGQIFVALGDGRLKLRLPGIATLDLTGLATDATELRHKQQESEKSLQRLIAPFSVAALSDLASRVERCNILSGQLVVADAELAAALGSDTLETIHNRECDLAASRDQILAAEPSWAAQQPDVQKLRAAVARRKADREQIQAEARAVWVEADRGRTAAADAAATATANWASNTEELAAADETLARLQTDGRTLGDRREDLDGKRRACDRAEDDLRSIDLTLAGLPQDALERATELARQIEIVKSQLQEIRESYQQDEAVMRAILFRGPYSSLAAAEERVRQLEEEYAGELLRVNAIKRLWDAIQKTKAKALEGLAEPVQQRATDILERIAGAPIATIELGANLAPSSVQPDGCTAEAPLDQMSAGEQEQIYFATRVALAEVVAQNERQVLLLDDPLVNTDGERLARTFDLIEEHCGRLQFVILSCHPDSYDPLHGAARQELAHGEILAMESLVGATA
jgi:DNA repair exonuclease SbcCD ATPase subunit